MSNIKNQYDTIGGQYLEGQQNFFNPREAWGRKMMLDMTPELAAAKTVVDVGCGDGQDIEVYKRQSKANIIGVEPSAFMLARARERLGDTTMLFQAGYEDMPGVGGADVVMGRFSLHYVDDLDQAWRRLASILKSGGVATFLVPHPMSDFSSPKVEGVVTPGGRKVVSMALFNQTVTVEYPVHTMAELLSPALFESFSLIGYAEFNEGDMTDSANGPAAMVLKIKKK